LTLAYYLRHNLTKKALQDMLCLLNAVVPGCVTASKYFIDRYFFNDNSKTEMHYYCPKCESYLGTNEDSPFKCGICNDETQITAAACKRADKYFLVHPLKDQLTYFFENKNLTKILEEQKKKINKLPSNTTKGEIYTGRDITMKKSRNFYQNHHTISQ
jgi:hypothetical protein